LFDLLLFILIQKNKYGNLSLFNEYSNNLYRHEKSSNIAIAALMD